ncbi:MAG TPA: glycosyltransferase family 2 protein [Terriglobales bacterium]|nr:glycosyltransferase family 2 protein [Terriglobales bacterium]
MNWEISKTAVQGPSCSPVLSIVIVTWNGKRYALECLESLRANGGKCPTEIIVVDNASTDGTPEAIRIQFPEVHVIQNCDNLGFAKANNIGVRQSRGKYVCLINSDVVVPPGCLDRMLAWMEAHEDVGIMGPKMLCPDGSVGLSVMRLPTVWNSLCSALALNSVFPKSKLFAGFSIKTTDVQAIRDVEVVTGWFWMASQIALGQVGGLDERFFMYGEDIDWCHRFRKAGWRVVFFGEAEALHYGGASSMDAPAWSYVEMRRANRQYFQKHHGTLGAIGYTLVIGIHEIARIAGYSLSYCYDQGRRREAISKVRRSLSCLQWLVGGNSLVTRHTGE